MKKDIWLKRIVFILLTLIVVLFIIKVSPSFLQSDTLYDIKLGEQYFKHGMFTIDPYSIHAGLQYQTHHYLICILFYLITSIFSLKGLYFLEIILYGVIAFLFYKLNRKMIQNKFIAYIFLIFELIAFYPFVSVRAWMFSSIIFLIELLCIQNYLSTNKKGYAIALATLPLLLINIHSGVIAVYFIILLTYMANIFKFKLWRITNDDKIKSKIKSFIYIFGIGALLTLINPYFVHGITYGFKTINNYLMNKYITEYQSPDFTSPLDILILVYSLICVVALLMSKKKIKIHELLLIGGTIFMAMTGIRHFLLLIITSIVILPHVESAYERIDKSNWDIVKSLQKGYNPMNIILGGFYVVILVYLLTISRSNTLLPSKMYPISATTLIKDYLPSNARIFNKYEWGSYLMYNDIKVFVDTRCDLYTKEYNPKTEVLKDYAYVMDHQNDYKFIINKYKIDYFLLDTKSYLSNKIIKDKVGKELYKDDISIIIEVIK
jgi:hypothetical protein